MPNGDDRKKESDEGSALGLFEPGLLDLRCLHCHALFYRSKACEWHSGPETMCFDCFVYATLSEICTITLWQHGNKAPTSVQTGERFQVVGFGRDRQWWCLTMSGNLAVRPGDDRFEAM
jgi:hypothetical protein